MTFQFCLFAFKNIQGILQVLVDYLNVSLKSEFFLLRGVVFLVQVAYCGINITVKSKGLNRPWTRIS